MPDAPAPVILVTNDDGIDSYFLRVLVEALQQTGFQTCVAAPMAEQSWISRALSRRRDVNVAEYTHFGCTAWAVDGTPTDCVNIALGHLLKDQPAAVVSGINLGHNTSLPYILSSGTIAGALEGAFWGLPALAFSMELPGDRIAQIRKVHGKVEGHLDTSLRCAGARAAEFVKARLQQANPDPAPIVHNINFPATTTTVTPVVHTRPAKLKLGSLFARQSPATFAFQYMSEKEGDDSPDADYNTIMRGCISHSILDYSFLGA